MSTTVDERVVEMRFDNGHFERNVSTTLSSLDKLKQSLNLDGAAKGFENIDSAAKSVNMSGLSGAVETVHAKFSALEVMAVTALANITNSAVNAGKRIATALTIEPIRTGLAEYETQINSVQTILANTQSKGTTLEDVNSALDTLNQYADKTIYNFTEMTRNIGTFTAAGVDLGTSVNAIQGIANLAAVSGSTSQQASTAMYQLSQALATGTVKLQDWNSVVNAGMGGQVFQDALIRTAAVMSGSAKNVEAWRKANIDSHGSFRDSLTEGAWLTTDVLTNTLSQFTGKMTDAELKAQGYTEQQIKDIQAMAVTAEEAATKVKTFTQLWDTLKEAAQSGWTQTWELVIGDFEEAKTLWTEVSDTIGGFLTTSAEARNNMLSEALDTNWEKLIRQIEAAGIETTVFEDKIKSVAESHDINLDKLIEKHGSLGEVFKSGAVSSDILKEAVDGLRTSLVDLSGIERVLENGHVGEDVKLAQETLKNLGHDLGDFGEGGVDGIFGAKTEEAVRAFQELKGLEVTGIIDDKTLSALKEASKGAKDLSENCDDLISKVTELGGREMLIESLKNIFNGLLSVVKPIKEAFSEIFPPVTAEQLKNALESFKELTAKFKLNDDQAKRLKDTFKGLFSAIDIGISFIKSIVGGLVKVVGSLLGFGDNVLHVTSSLGNFISNIRDSIKATSIFETVIGTITSYIQKAIDVIAGLTNPGFSGMSTFFENILQCLEKISGRIFEIVSNIFSGIYDAFKNGDMDSIINLFNSGIFAGILLGIKKFVNNFTDSFTSEGVGIFDKIKEALDGVTGVLDGVRDSLKAWQQDLKANVLLKIALSIAILVASISVLSNIDPAKLNSSLGAITVLFGELVGALAIFSKIHNPLKGTLGSLIGMSVAILILASAMKTLSDLNMEQIENSLYGIGGLAVILAVTAKLISSKSGAMMKGSVGLIALAVAIKILGTVCKDLSSLEWEELAKGVSAVSVLLAAVAGFAKLTSKNKQLISTGIAVVIFGGALKVLANACSDFADMNLEELCKSVGSIGVLLAAIAGFAKLTSNNKQLMSTGISVVIFGAALQMIVSVFERLGKLSIEQIGQSLMAIIGTLFTIGIVAKLLPEKDLLTISAVFPAISSALIVLAEAFERLGKLSIEQIGKSLLATAGAFVLIAGVSSKMNGSLKAAASLIAISAAIWILASAMAAIGSLGLVGVIATFAGLATVFVSVGVAAALLKPLIPTIFALSASIATLGASLVLLGAGIAVIGTGLLTMMTSIVAAILSLQGLSWAAIGKGLLVIASAFAIIGVSALLLKPLVPTILSVSASIALLSLSCVAIAAGIALIVAALSTLSLLGESGAQSLASSLKIVIVGILETIVESIPLICESAKLLILGLVDVLVSSVDSIANGVLVMVTGVLEALTQYGPQIIDFLITFIIDIINGLAVRMPEIVQSIMNLIGSTIRAVIDALDGLDTTKLLVGTVVVGLMTGLIYALSAISGLIPGAMLGILGVGAVIAEIALVLAAIGGLAQIPGLQWLIEEGGQLLSSIGTAIGGFVGSLVGGIASGFTSHLPQIGSDLGAFMTNAQPFIDGAKSIDSSVLDGATSLAGVILAITGANLLDSIASFITGGSSLTSFAEQIVPLGTAISDFAEEVKNVNPDTVTAASNAGKLLAEMSSALPNSGGIVGWFTGENDMTGFGSQLKSFGTAIAEFGEEVKSVNPDTITAAANAGKTLSELASSLPNSGGVVGWFMGENDMGTFGTQLKEFGTAIADFAGEVDGVDADTVISATNAGKAISELAKSLPNSGGVAGWFMGENDMGTFGAQLKKFGTGIKNYSDAVDGVNTDVVSNSVKAGKAIVELAKSLPNSGGVAGFFAGENDIGTFGSQLKKFGVAINSYSKSVTEVSPSAVQASVTAAKDILSLINSTATINTDNVGSFVGAINKLGTADVDSFVAAFSSASDLSSVGTNMMDSLSKGISSRNGAVTNSLNRIIADALDVINGKKTAFTAAGIETISRFISGILRQKNRIKSVMTSSVENTVSAIKDYYGRFYNAGSYLVSGFANGISANSYRAAAKARAMASAAARAAENELDINSPSRVGYGIGNFFGLGFVNAIGEYARKAYTASSQMATFARNGLSDAISKVSEFISADVDTQPTIRPVLDLSDVSSGVNTMNSMFALQPSVGLLSNVGTINTMMNRRQNGNGDIISAIKDLKNTVGGASGNTYVIDGITYDDGSNVSDAVRTLIRAAKVERRS